MLSSAKPRKKLDPINEPYATQNLRLHTVGRRVQFDSLQHFACRSCPTEIMGCLPSKPEDDPQTSAVDALIESFTNDAFQILRQIHHIEKRSRPTPPSRAERYRGLRYRCMATLSGHTDDAGPRRPV